MNPPLESRFTATLDIKDLLEDYFDVLYFHDLTLFDHVFHPAAVVYTVQDGAVAMRSAGEYRQVLQSRRSPSSVRADRDDVILSIELLSPESATARTRVCLFGVFVEEYLTVLLTGGRWTVMTKLYHPCRGVYDPKFAATG
ncbi:nuclear transport factor 2 family protein [Nocardia terpenica]|uniref:Nuclear transport factor 2 family protein n=1 Tax=Nocardia terpenica TaxID=455432 RepID=A0A291RN37_9NOCA|nr:nuclear transport factor 2 family protein [Nocardia terpenica]ATL68787.1 hypothetical protein CRH09_23940 [Nocardia terpenica]